MFEHGGEGLQEPPGAVGDLNRFGFDVIAVSAFACHQSTFRFSDSYFGCDEKNILDSLHERHLMKSFQISTTKFVDNV